jgi:hypothetical protein
MMAEVRRFEARIMSNPLDAVSMMKLASIAGKINQPVEMQRYIIFAENVRQKLKADADWSVETKLDLAEGFLACGQREMTRKLCREVLSEMNPSTSTKSGAGQITRSELLSHLLLALSGSSDEEIQFRTFAAKEKTLNPEDFILVGFYFSFFSEPFDPAFGLTVARQTFSRNPKSLPAKVVYCSALLKAGQIKEAVDVLKTIREKDNPLVLLVQSMMELKTKSKSASETIAKGLRLSPYGPIRNLLLMMAKEVGLSEPPTPDFSGIGKRLSGLSESYLTYADRMADSVGVDLSVSGDLSKGGLTKLSVTIKNNDNITLTIGPGSLVHPVCEIEMTMGSAGKESAAQKYKFFVPIEKRQILERKRTLELSSLLDQAQLGGKPFDRFIAEHSEKEKVLSLFARIYSTRIISQPTNVVLAASKPITIRFPLLNRRKGEELIKTLDQIERKPLFGEIRLARWMLMSRNVSDLHADMSNVLLKIFETSDDPMVQAQIAWAIRKGMVQDRMVNGLAKRLNSKDWFVRFMALDTLGELQGKKATKLFQHFAVNDKDELVRKLSAGYLLYTD